MNRRKFFIKAAAFVAGVPLAVKAERPTPFVATDGVRTMIIRHMVFDTTQNGYVLSRVETHKLGNSDPFGDKDLTGTWMHEVEA